MADWGSGIYLKVEDLMKLTGSRSRNYSQKKLRALKREAGKVDQWLTIGDYCKITAADYTEIYQFLRGELPPWLEKGAG